jgi:hypothetical protein
MEPLPPSGKNQKETSPGPSKSGQNTNKNKNKNKTSNITWSRRDKTSQCCQKQHQEKDRQQEKRRK